MAFTLSRHDLHKPTASWYSEYLASAKWKAFRAKLVRERGVNCEWCKDKEQAQAAHVLHHKTYARLFNELPEDVVLLCKGCHMYTHEVHNIPYLFLIYEENMEAALEVLRSTHNSLIIAKPNRRK